MKNRSDPVHWPSHYNQGEIECIDAMLAAYGPEAVETYCIVAAFKYIWRFNGKGGNEDLKKAIWYLRFATGDDPRKDENAKIQNPSHAASREVAGGAEEIEVPETPLSVEVAYCVHGVPHHSI